MGRHSTAESLKEYFNSGVNKKKWEEAKERAKQSNFATYDDGKYTAQLVDISVGRSKASNRLQVVSKFKFTEGEYKGKNVSKFNGIDDKDGKGVEFLLRDLKSLGFPDVDLEDVEEEVFSKLNKKKPVVNIQLKTKEGSEYQNLFILGVEEAEEKEEEEDEDNDQEADESEDDSKKTEESDDDDDEEGEEEAESEDSEDDEDEEEEEEEKKPATKSKPEAEDEDDEEDEDEDAEEEAEELDIEIGSKLKVQYNKEVVKAKVIKLDEEKGRVKVKMPDGEKVWVTEKEIVSMA